MIKIEEGLRAGDLEGTIEKRFSVDQYKSKMGEDKENKRYAQRELEELEKVIWMKS